MAKLSLRIRAAVALPWIRVIRRPDRCEAMKGGAPLKAYWKRDHTRQDDPEILDKWRCTRLGRYRYRYLKRGFHHGETKHFCWSHLVYRALLDMDEIDRADRWWKRHGWLNDDGRLIDAHSSRESRRT